MRFDIPSSDRGPATMLLLVMMLLAGREVSGVPAPYADDFDGYATGATPSGFVTASTGLNTNSSWAIARDGMNGRYVNSLFTNQGSTAAAIALTNLSGTDFIFSSTFVLGAPFTTSTMYNCQVGIAAFVDTSSLHTDASGYHVTYETFTLNAPFITPGSLSLQGVETISPGTGSTLPVVAGTTYTITVAGVYTPGGLILTATLSDGANSISRSGFDSTPATGTFFGYTNSASASVQRAISASVQFDNFAVVPEPSTVSFVLLGAIPAGFTVLRRRMRR